MVVLVIALYVIALVAVFGVLVGLAGIAEGDFGLGFGFMLIAGFVFLLTFGSASYITAHYDEHETTITVTKTTSSDSKGNRVYTKTNETYEVSDSLWYGRWNSADDFGKLIDGHTYKVTVAGARVPFLSMMPNIVEIEEVK